MKPWSPPVEESIVVESIQVILRIQIVGRNTAEQAYEKKMDHG